MPRMDDFDPNDGVDPELVADVNQKIVKMDERTMKFGLHLQGAALMVDPTNVEEMMVVASFSVGDLAWSDKVQNPPQHNIDEEFRELTRVSQEEALDAYRKRLLGDDQDG